MSGVGLRESIVRVCGMLLLAMEHEDGLFVVVHWT